MIEAPVWPGVSRLPLSKSPDLPEFQLLFCHPGFNDNRTRLLGHFRSLWPQCTRPKAFPLRCGCFLEKETRMFSARLFEWSSDISSQGTWQWQTTFCSLRQGLLPSPGCHHQPNFSCKPLRPMVYIAILDQSACGRRDGLVVKTTACYSKEPESSPQYLHGSSQLCLTSV